MDNRFAILHCKSGICSREDGYKHSEVPENFPTDGTLICFSCKPRLDALQIEREAQYRADQNESRLKILALRNIQERQYIEEQLFDFGTDNSISGEDVQRKAIEWVSGPQHLSGPFYICSRCRRVKHDPNDFGNIHAAGKTPIMKGNTLCDTCYDADKFSSRVIIN